MGGDDLGSDDEYVTGPPRVRSIVSNNKGNDDLSSQDDDNDNDVVVSSGRKEPSSSVTREKRNRDGTTNHRETLPPTSLGSGGTDKSTSKRRKQGGPMQVLGGTIRHESILSKADILSKFANVVFQPQYIARPQHSDNIDNNNEGGGHSISIGRMDSDDNVMDRLTSLIAKKQLKAKVQKKSPRAIILCLSARRAVAVLKDLAPLKLRVAKFFPKQGTIDDQARQLETIDFGVAVGTPHRISELIERGSLSLGGTRLVGLDTYENDKGFSVYTLLDTAPHTEKLLRDYVHPECVRRKDFVVGFI
jgi:hypothetical protein